MRRLDDGWATNRGYEEDETGQLAAWKPLHVLSGREE